VSTGVPDTAAPVRITDWDDAYANRDHIPGADAIIARWPVAAAAFRAARAARSELDLPYGPAERNRLDLFRPDGAAQGLVVFVHGGYWRAFDRRDWSHLAAGAVARGWAVAMPSYSLVPAIHIAGITQEIAVAITEAATLVDGPIRLIGHSAGGHLVVRQVCDDTRLPPEVLERIAHVLSVSGVHDLRPLLRTAINHDLGLTGEEASAESPALRRPLDGARVTAWVGDAERPEFVRQTTLLANVWTGLGAAMAQVIEPGRHHFDVIDSLGAADGALTAMLLA
jgi:acetyl esterase/lipase